MTVIRGLLATLAFALLARSDAWAQRLIPAPPGGEYCLNTDLCHDYGQLYFTSAGTGYASDGRNLFSTTNAGTTWTPILGPIAGSSEVGELFFVNESVFFSYREGQHEFLKTTDGGKTFAHLATTGPSLRKPGATDTIGMGFFFIDAEHGWAPGDETVFFTTDGGMTWKVVSLPAGAHQAGRIWMFDAQHGIADSNDQIFKTEDAGLVWRRIPNTPEMDLVRCLKSGFCLGCQTGSDSDVKAAYISRDGGQTWQATQTGIDGDKDFVNDCQAIPGGAAVIVGAHNDQGESEVQHLIGTGTPIPAPPPDRAFLVKWDGTAWQRTEYPEIGRFREIQYVTLTEAWASADHNGIIHSTDGGQSWTFVPDYYRQIVLLTPSPTPFVFPTPAPTP
jgi:photosystem II stability/assembly factor-like uncharacterized protein